MDFNSAYIDATITSQPKLGLPQYQPQPQPQIKMYEVEMVNNCDQQIESLEQLYQSEIKNLQSNYDSALNNANNEILKLSSYINEQKKKNKEKISEPALEQVCKINTNRKWLITIIISICILLFTSTYTVNFIDNWLDNHNVDLFSTTDKMNELLLLIIQFIFIVIVVRLILQFV